MNRCGYKSLANVSVLFQYEISIDDTIVRICTLRKQVGDGKVIKCILEHVKRLWNVLSIKNEWEMLKAKALQGRRGKEQETVKEQGLEKICKECRAPMVKRGGKRVNRLTQQSLPFSR